MGTVNLDLTKPLNGQGRFWIPDDTNKTSTGRLNYDPATGIEIEITSPLSADAHAGHVEAYPIVHGQLINGDSVTLVDAFVTSRHFGSGGDGPTTMRVNRAIFGIYTHEADQMQAKSCSFSNIGLGQWLGVNGLSSNEVYADGERVGLDIRYRSPAEIKIPISKPAIDLSIKWGFSWRSRYEESNIELLPQAFIVARSECGCSVADFRKVVWEIQRLMSLLIGQVPLLQWVNVEPTVTGTKGSIQHPLLFAQRAQGKPQGSPASRPLLSYPEVREVFPVIVNNWFLQNEQAKLAAMVYLESLLMKSSSVNAGFLNMVHAVEAYHRSLGDEFYMDQTKFDAAIGEFSSKIPEAIQGDHRESLKNRLKYGNEYSMRRRLSHMLERIPETFRIRIAGETYSRFVQKVVATRNYFTHWDVESKGDAFSDGKDILNATQRLRCLFIASILHDLGIADQTVENSIKGHADFAFWPGQPLTQ